MSRDLTDKDTRREALAAELVDGVDALVSSDAWASYLASQAKFHRYSFGNTLLIMAQCPHASRVAGFNAWHKHNRYVKGPNPETGERQHAIWIWGPCSKKVTRTDADTGEEKSRWIPSGRYTPVPVYDISQTDGEPLPEPNAMLTGEDEFGHLARLVKVAESAGFPVSFVDIIADSPNANGVTRRPVHGQVKGIEIATSGRDPLMQVKTMCHELGHAFLHIDIDAESLDAMPTALRELEAESVAYIVAGTLGVDTSAYSFGYVAHWANGDAKAARELIRLCGERIQGAAKRILDALAEQTDADRTDVAA